MANPVPPPEVTTERVQPLVIVAGTLLAVILLTFVIYSVSDYSALDSGPGNANLADPATGGGGTCGQGTVADGSYSVDLATTPNPPRPEGTTLLLTPRRDGKPIIGAKVCISTDMPDMPHPPLDLVAKEGSGGRYEARVLFGMGGQWRTWVTIAEPEKPPVSVLLKIEVAPPE